jgi:hypothetical protein
MHRAADAAIEGRWNNGPVSEQPGRYQRSTAGMLGAMLVLLLVVGAFVVFRELNRDEPPNPAVAQDFLTPAKYARTAADFPLLAPDRLPDGWIATSVSFTDGKRQAWHLGTLTDDRRYVGLEQAERPVDGMVEDYVDPEATQGDDVTIDGQTWQTFTDSGDDLAIVRQADGVTTLLVGPVSEATLEELLATLR